MPRLRLDLAYDGGGFAGWAAQPGLRTCQGVVERALSTIAREPIRVTVAGRTDAGVHASGQVAHADVPDALAADATERAERVAHRLSRLAAPEGDLVVRAVSLAPPGFDARFSAVSRSYRYRIVTGPADPLERRTAAHVPHGLDVEAMRRAAEALVGLRDFAAFCRPREGATTIRELREFSWMREGQLLTASLTADAFCHSMVRALVAACVRVGEGRMGLAQAAALLDERQRSPLTGLMPAHGLTLVAVGYPPDEGLAQQAERARARRSASDLEE
ncbi:tRNA pseudouridine(38-40) synthase TruA [Agrococcus sp. Marseille-Q4369]|uniref:tRNA pseudouridine(38-40) synthase TruA n=1 Tax=Agrococcus sp. Marseille-Q4369 TaxID=2810513 RepID=UPI001B8B3393|nr:tRNA pseudouridine(38-40) synthase TruA [Agrococcus sp. Marseille-Q4369]QUW17615.1 tRNA pseudouridine(38-40) synthase TruA [Agrococcus sp. Marseille-Q4369]